jgi:hypothetical protein
VVLCDVCCVLQIVGRMGCVSCVRGKDDGNSHATMSVIGCVSVGLNTVMIACFL